MRHVDRTTLKPFANFSTKFRPLPPNSPVFKTSKRRENEQGEILKCDRGVFFRLLSSPSAGGSNCIEKANPITLWNLTLLTLTPFARFENWRISWEGSTFCEKVGKRLESGAIDMPQVCEGCTSETKVKLLAERGAFLEHCAVGAPTLNRASSSK